MGRMDKAATLLLDIGIMTKTQDRSPARIALAFLDAIVRGDLPTLDALLGPTATWWVQGWGELDRASLLAGLQGTISRSTERRMDIARTTAEADRVAIEAQGSFTFAEGVYANSYVYIIVTDEDGRIVEGREYLDTAVAAQFYAADG